MYNLYKLTTCLFQIEKLMPRFILDRFIIFLYEERQTHSDDQEQSAQMSRDFIKTNKLPLFLLCFPAINYIGLFLMIIKFTTGENGMQLIQYSKYYLKNDNLEKGNKCLLYISY